MHMATSTSIPSSSCHPQSPTLTTVELVYEEGIRNYRLLFGKPVQIVNKEMIFGLRTKKIAFFKPGDIFALDLWERCEYGTKSWTVYVLQAAAIGEVAYPVPQVFPAAKILLEACGKSRAQKAIHELQEIQDRVDPTTLPPARFLLTDFRIKADRRHQHRR
jgi:hypothetical protein